MPEAPATLSTPLLLLAMPQVLDPFFHRTVVLLIRHEDEGSLGFIVNRPTGIKVTEILKGMEVDWRGREDTVAYFGGPVQPNLGTVLFGPQSGAAGASPAAAAAATAGGGGADFEGSAASEVLAGVSLTQHVGDLSRLAEAPPERFRLFLGYAGWGAGQLIEEILRNDWLTAPARGDLIFAPDPERLWSAALESVGVDPATLPSWTPGGNGEETAN
ncbi:MAG: YqgE/AlgH family protein [Acidobacteria bacterium]|nr:YqgE/AlgH family protein [Acidobacteriota bacterium]